MSDAENPERQGTQRDTKSSEQSGNQAQLFKPIDGVTSIDEALEVESFCVNCGENGVTKLLLTMIPFYKEVILSSFSCPHCSYTNNEIQSAGDIQEKGVEYKLKVREEQDLNRKVVKSDFASISIPELDFEIPAKSQKGEVTTVEGILLRVVEGLRQEQPQRLERYPEDHAGIEEFLVKLERLKDLEHPFLLILRDSSGRSFICPPSGYSPGQADAALTLTRFDRTSDENHELGIYTEAEAKEEDEVPTSHDGNGNAAEENLRDEILKFSVRCSNCGASCETKMKLVKIPLFKEVIVMATDCEQCGHKTNEVKSGTGIEEKGQKIEIRVEDAQDFSRDLLKSETCSIEIPCLDLHVGSGTLGGKFTTLEGILNDIKDQVIGSHSQFFGDSEPEMKGKIEAFSAKFDRCLALEEHFTVILDDPAGNSYVQNIQAPDDDPQLTISRYERTFEQNEDLGLNDMKTENYAAD